MKAKRNVSRATMIRSLLSKRLPAEEIVARVKKACGGKPTVGYVNWIARTSRRRRARRSERERPVVATP